ncbi:DUF1131 domain-containing protein [Chthonobacter rhizosphaerae]|uniref:DUF1131 domain-containing protein n=1 Tax=Chthonobacter rhizosphaerae TaxID=2735553 RepID=UPI0015EE54CD|nr:DUF1131 domain-containing protein [Chthonobacter rhizosphaerae]
MGSRRIPSIVVLAFALSAAGCSAGLDMAVDEGATGTVDLLALSAEGIRGLPAGTGYSEAAVEAALPGFDATPVTMATETDTLAALALFHDGLQVAQVLPGEGGRIGAVHGVSARLRGPGGEHIGMTLAEARVGSGSCRIGTGNWVGMPICPSRAAPNVSLVFSTSGLAATEAEALATATLQRMIWTPPPEGSS